ncbi:MAG: glutamate synthase large subunit [Bacteroidales bacterium]
MSLLKDDAPQAQGLYLPQNEHDNCGIGFVAHIKGKKSHNIVKRGLEVLVNMDHRGARGADGKTGDGAGILTQIPHGFFISQGLNLPPESCYGAGLVFLPRNKEAREKCMEMVEDTISDEGLEFITSRNVPVNSDVLGEIAKQSEPFIIQIFVTGNFEPDTLDRKLYLVRKQIEKKIRKSDIDKNNDFYVVSLSTRTIIYKGMLTPDQVEEYFLDLQDTNFTSAISLVHSRFSTNTFPAWSLAQPFRTLAHNGEINTVKGNRFWMGARESVLASDLFENDLKKLYPIIEPGKSDSASLDNALEFLNQTGRSLHHSLCILIPESWNDKNPIPDSLKAFYEYHSTLMEPWDGPASIVFSDGRFIGGTLDRNGLRPSRYVITDNDLIVMGSEIGVQTFNDESIVEKGRLKPGKILLVDTKFGIIIPDSDVKSQLSSRNPYKNWLDASRVLIEDVNPKKHVSSSLGEKYDDYMRVFKYSKEDVDAIIMPMAKNGQEPTGSMGNDTPMAVLSEKPQRLFSYFRQTFAQVTNPAIDPLRESLVMSLDTYIGSMNKNLLEESAEQCSLIKFGTPIITNTDLGKIKDLVRKEFSHKIIDTTFEISKGESEMSVALEKVLNEALQAVNDGNNFVILSDRAVSKDRASIPILLAVAAVNQHLIDNKRRVQVGIIVETADAREVNDFALLLAYGASVVNPYMAFAILNEKAKNNPDDDYVKNRTQYMKAIDKGLLKIMSKMGISTLRSYHGSRNFEVLGLNSELVQKYFRGTVTKIEGLKLDDIAYEVLENHKEVFEKKLNKSLLDNLGIYSYRFGKEEHSWSPEAIALLQWSTKTGDYKKYKQFAELINHRIKAPHYIRGMFEHKKNPISIDAVEPIESIMKRFCTGAMSYGSISKEAHEALAIAMNTIGGRSNTGEGGEDAARFGSIKNSKIKQIASGRFGVTANYLVNAQEIQIKIAQGAKPGEGGQLPGFKVNKVIAKLRNSTPGITLISPPPHHDIYSIEDLAQLIFDLKNVNPNAKVSVKLVSQNGVGTVAAGVAKANADLIVISGTEGGTGASPQSSIKHVGMPLEIGVAEVQQTLVLNNLRGRIKLQTDGQLRTGMDVVYSALLGAEEFGFATGALITLGCVMMRKCHLNTCPAGIATQNKRLRKRYLGHAEYVINYFKFVAEEVRELLAELGYKSMDEIIGRADLLEPRKDLKHRKHKTLDVSPLIYMPKEAKINAIRNVESEVKTVGQVLDHQIIVEVSDSIESKHKTWIAKTIQNTDRTVGAMLSGAISKVHGEAGLPPDTINCEFKGSAGQSFGAFAVNGLSLKLVGDANDYVAKGLSGGKIIVVPPVKSHFIPENNIIIGNTVLYGATSGSLFVRGVAGERFAVRNSGAKAVIEGVGDHCCEYMTGGRVVVLGKTGRNFAAGMSGGIAYVLDERGNFDYYCNKGLVSLDKLETDDIYELQELINQHLISTNSSIASKVLTNWQYYLPKFIKVIPFEYKKVLEETKLQQIKKQLQQTTEETSHQE